MQSVQPIASSLEHPQDKDGELIQAAQSNPAMFQKVYDRWAVRIYQYFYFRTVEPTSAEDLTSQLFLSVYQAMPRYQHRGYFAAWLFAIARNLSKEYFRKANRETPLELAERIPASSDPLSDVADQDEIARLRRLIQSLEEDEQELIRLRYVAELSFADMALILNKREDAVKKSLYRLQARLQSLLEQNHD